MRRRAARVDENQQSIVEALRKAGCKVLSLASQGKGCPDLLVMEPVPPPDERGPFLGRLLLMEVKNPAKPKSDRKLTPDQVAWHAEWAGAPLAVVETAEQALAAIQM